MRIASWSWGGRPQVGTVSADGREVTPLSVPTRPPARFALIQAQARGRACRRRQGRASLRLR
jgi:hypothetical protein